MASTNSTTHYELSQYVGTDKPTYLVDYNQDMSKIDAGIYAAKSEADTNTASIGTLSELTTTVKTDLVSAVNEVNGETSTIGNVSNLTTTVKTDLVSAINEVNGETSTIGDVANLTTTVKTNTVAAINEVDGDIGDLTNLTTTSKSNLVSAINELDGDIGNLANLETTTKSSVVGAINEHQNFVDYMSLTDYRELTEKTVPSGTYSGLMNIALNNTGSCGKVYGYFSITSPNSDRYVTYTNTGIQNVSEEFVIRCAGFVQNSNDKGISQVNLRIQPAQGNETSARVQVQGPVYGNIRYDIYIFPCLYFFKDFGDTE